MKKSLLCAGIAAVMAGPALVYLNAHQTSGAIFTTVSDGSEVNYNIYDFKEDVFLDGGPGPGAPQHAAGLDDGTYVFQVTDPSGKALLSQDIAKCRQVTVANGIITGLVFSGAGCLAKPLISNFPNPPGPAGSGTGHNTGLDIDHGAVTVQLMPFLDTPNPGNEYKVWLTYLEDFLDSCQALGENDGLNVVDCGDKKGGNAHGFRGRHSKTDNFKVRGTIGEGDTIFRRGSLNGPAIDGLGITWTDTNGASNQKWSYLDLSLDVNHEAHVEALEIGTHSFVIENQPGCTIGQVTVDGKLQKKTGPQTVTVTVTGNTFANGKDTIFIIVQCL